MERTVESLESEVKTELRESRIQGHESVQRFEAAELANSYSGDPELWSLWYPNIYSGIFDSVDQFLMAPIESENVDASDAYESLETGIESLIDRVSSVDQDTQPLLNLRKRFDEFRESERDQITIIVKIHGNDSELEFVNGYFDEGIVSVDLNGSPTPPEESTLREYHGKIIDSFCGWSPYRNRPNNRFKRELHISLKKNHETQVATIDVQSQRMKYTLMEKIALKLGFSSPYGTEPTKEL